MKLLLDTHVLLWWLTGQPLEPRAAEAVADVGTLVAVSAASLWEIAIKRALGKLRFDGSVDSVVREARFEPLPITASHAELAAGLPDHHRDPFDRMLVAQARSEQLTLATRDPAFDRYDVAVLRA